MKATHNKSNYKPDKNEHLSKNHCYSLSLPRRTKHPAQTQVIAHRGYWKAEGSAQNSLASLRKAAEAKVYGAEFDVQMTATAL